MNMIKTAFCLVILSSFAFTNVFDFTITMPDGNVQSLNVYEGKSLLIVVLPAIENDRNEAVLHSLDTLQHQFKDSITIIGIPSYEDGYADDSLENVMAWYHSILDSSFVIAQGMNTRKSSPYQADLFHWLTHADENGHFDQDVTGSGEKFLITKDGYLFGLVSPDAPFNADIVGEMLNTTE